MWPPLLALVGGLAALLLVAAAAVTTPAVAAAPAAGGWPQFGRTDNTGAPDVPARSDLYVLALPAS